MSIFDLMLVLQLQSFKSVLGRTLNSLTEIKIVLHEVLNLVYLF